MLQKTKLRLKKYAERILEILNRSSRGALVAAMIAALICILYLGSAIRTGLPFIVDLTLVLLGSIFLTLLIFGASYYLYRIIRKVNKYIVTAVIGTFLLTAILPDEKFNRPFIFVELICGILVGISINRRASVKEKLALILLAVAINVVLFALLFSKGANHAIPVSKKYWEQQIPVPEKTEDPMQKQVYKVGHLFYGTGTDKQRPEYGKNVSLKTEPVDGSVFLQPLSAIKSKLRNAYWGFGTDRLPLNARVWYPEQKGNFPLVVFVHGNHLMSDYSDEGYAYMGELLASKGFIVVSIDENFLNESWFDDFWFGEMNTRAWLILKHLEYWRKWSTMQGNPFQGKVDMNNICLVGHSRGADAVSIALALNKLDKYPYDGRTKFNFNFSIKSIVQIAPAGRQARGIEFPLKLKNVNYLLLHGSHDQDVYYCAGIKMYNRIRFDSSQNYLKAILYIYKANHGQFNTKWGLKDKRFPTQYFVNSATLLNGEDQRKIADIYISAFLHATLQGQKQYLPLLKDYRNGFDFLPRNYYINQYEDNSFKYLADFEEDQDLLTASMAGCSVETGGLKTWAERVLPLRNGEEFGQENVGVYLEWDYKKTDKAYPYYAVNVSSMASGNDSVNGSNGLFFFVSNNSDLINQVNFSIQVKTKSCVITKPLNDFYIMAPLLKTELAKWNYLSDVRKNMPVERVLQFVQLPFVTLKKMDPRFRPGEIEQVKFIFDKQPAGDIIIDKIGYN